MTARTDMDGKRAARTGRLFGRPAAALLALAVAVTAPVPAAAQSQICEPMMAPRILLPILKRVQRRLVNEMFGPPDGLFDELAEAVTRQMQQVVAGDTALTSDLDVPVVSTVVGALDDMSGGLLSNVPVIGPLIDGFSLSPAGLNYGGLGYMDRQMRLRLDTFWGQVSGGLQSMTAQLHASGLNTSRMLSSMDDAGSLSGSAIELQDGEIDDKLAMQVSDESCQFDTLARSLGPAEAVSTAMSTAYSEQFNGLGNLTVGTPGAQGPAEFRRMRFQRYLNSFCDVNSNGGNAPCSAAVKVPPGTEVATPYGVMKAAFAAVPTAPPKPNANAAISPSATIFSKDTIDLADGEKRTAVEELVTNIIGYEPPPPIPEPALRSAAGKHQRQKNREFTTKMEVAAAPIWDAIAMRAGGADAPHAQQMRQKVGQPNASPKPSEKELLKTVLDQLSNPAYAVNMNSGGGTVLQKEVYLKAYNATLVYKLLEKEEKIANVFAVETADMAQKLKDVSAGQYKDSPVGE